MISETTLYVWISIWILFQGETALIGAGHLIYSGTVKFWIIASIATFLSAINGELLFTLSRTSLKFLPFVLGNLKDKISSATILVQKYKTPILLFSRFIYGFRNLIPIVFGLSDMKHHSFSILNFASALIWALTFTSAGLLSGKALSIFLDVRRYQMIILGVFLGIAFTITVLKILKFAKTKKDGNYE